jgi:hypothetical protein
MEKYLPKVIVALVYEYSDAPGAEAHLHHFRLTTAINAIMRMTGHFAWNRYIEASHGPQSMTKVEYILETERLGIHVAHGWHAFLEIQTKLRAMGCHALSESEAAILSDVWGMSGETPGMA